MFLESFIRALHIWKEPRFLGWVLLLVLAYGVYSWAIRLTTSPKESIGAAAPGCLVQLLSVLLLGTMMGVFVLFAMPKWMGLGEPAGGWGPFLFLAIRAGILATLAVTALSFIPGLGRWVASSPGLEALLIGGTVFRLTVPLFFERSPLGRLGQDLTFPGLGFTFLYPAAAVFFSKFLLLALETLTRRFQSPSMGRVIRTLGPILDLLLGIFILSAYASWARLAQNIP